MKLFVNDIVFYFIKSMFEAQPSILINNFVHYIIINLFNVFCYAFLWVNFRKKYYLSYIASINNSTPGHHTSNSYPDLHSLGHSVYVSCMNCSLSISSTMTTSTTTLDMYINALIWHLAKKLLYETRCKYIYGWLLVVL